jgi:hypothetical protein
MRGASGTASDPRIGFDGSISGYDIVSVRAPASVATTWNSWERSA